MNTGAQASASRLALLVVVILLAVSDASNAIDEKSWATSRYKVQIHIAVDSSATPGAVSAEKLLFDIDQMVHLLIYPLWDMEIVISEGSERIALLTRLRQLEQDESSHGGEFDKHLFLTVKANRTGWQLACRERDSLTGRWTPIIQRTVRQNLLLSKHCFELICETFAPLAMVRVDTNDAKHTILDLMGSELSRQTDEEFFITSTTVFEPFLYRSSRGHGNAADNMMTIPWTFLSTDERDANAWKCDVYSATRLPFGTRRRAGIETMAIELKTVLPATEIRFYASHKKSQGLAGYEVFEKVPGEKDFTSLGTTDQWGGVVVKRGSFPISLIALRSDAQLLANIPIVPGATAEIDVPISDDTARLMVQESLTTFKEQLIDTVARRNILIARTRDQLKKGKKAEALKLLDQLDELPNRSALSRQLDSVENNADNRSENPRVQAKIQRMLSDSRKLLSTFLSTREVAELEIEVKNSNNSATNQSPPDSLEQQM